VLNWQVCLLDHGPEHSRPGVPLRPVGLCLHSTADVGATAQQIRDYFNTHRGASAHIVCDWTEALQLIPWVPGVAEIAWHAGPSANTRFLSIELCESTDPVQFQASYALWIATAASVCSTCSWPADDDHVWSHAKVSATFHEVDHVDPIPYLARWNVTWNQVLSDIQANLKREG
jgi:N-acetylmuramoyl-L-alanine amidase CwlA